MSAINAFSLAAYINAPSPVALQVYEVERPWSDVRQYEPQDLTDIGLLGDSIMAKIKAEPSGDMKLSLGWIEAVIGGLVTLLVTVLLGVIGYHVSEMSSDIREGRNKLDGLTKQVSESVAAVRKDITDNRTEVVQALTATNGKIDVTNTKLDTINGKLGETNTKLDALLTKLPPGLKP